MINVNELMIGNWVKLETVLPQYEIIDGLTNNLGGGDVRPIHLAGNGIWNAERQIFGIPLTPEILIACGFEKYSQKLFGKLKTHYSKSPFSYTTLISWEAFPMKHIKHLHQLQNLYFSLTGQELNVNLK